MIVSLKEDFQGMYEGSRFPVSKQTDTHYEGLWSSMFGSYNVSVPKELCEVVDEEKETIEKEKLSERIAQLIEEENKDNPKWQAEKKVRELAEELGVKIYILD